MAGFQIKGLAGNDTWLLFGGTDGQKTFNDLWKITFDPVTTELVFEEVKPSTATMPTPRANHAAFFADGKLILTENHAVGLLISETMWDQKSNSWIAVKLSSNGSVSVEKAASTHMDDGMWLISGGLLQNGEASSQIYVFDPANKTVNKAGDLPPLTSGSSLGRFGQQLTALAGGKAILTGGSGIDPVTKKPVPPDGKAYLFDKKAGWSSLEWNSNDLELSFSYHNAITLPDNKILVTGGVKFDTEPEIKEGDPLDVAFTLLFPGNGNTLTTDKVQKLTQPRASHATVIVEDGNKRHVMLVGGRSSAGKFVPLAQAECLASTMVCVWTEKQ